MPGLNRAQPDARFLRELAIDLLAAVRDFNGFNKESLFVDTIHFYRWYFKNIHCRDEMQIYILTFGTHYPHLVGKRLDGRLQEAAFLTWFIDNGFDQLPLLKVDSLDDLQPLPIEPRKHPLFDGPVDPCQSYLTWWLEELLNRAPEDNEHRVFFSVEEINPPGKPLLFFWTSQLLCRLSIDSTLARQKIGKNCLRFFSWCCLRLDSWEPLLAYMELFYKCEPSASQPLSNQNEWDARFINWFIDNNFDQQSLLDWTDMQKLAE